MAAAISEYDEATENLVNAAMDTAAAKAAGNGFHEAVQALVSAAMAVAKLAPGFRFEPTDDELIRCYLKKKVNNEPIPLAEMKVTNVRLYNPITLADTLPRIDDRAEWYFFTPRVRKYKNGKRPNRETDSGFWKATGADKNVKYENKTIGFKKALVFYLGGHVEGGIKSAWIMNEYRLNKPPRSKEFPNDMRLDDWVLCKIYKQTQREVVKRRKRKEKPLPPPPEDEAEAEDQVLEQEHYVEQLRETLDAQQPLISNNASTSGSAEIEAEHQYYRHQQDDQEQLPELELEREPNAQQPLINKEASASAGAEQYGSYLPTLHVPAHDDNAAELEQNHYPYQEQIPGFGFVWKDFLNFNMPDFVDQDYMSSSMPLCNTSNQAFGTQAFANTSTDQPFANTSNSSSQAFANHNYNNHAFANNYYSNHAFPSNASTQGY